MNCPACKRTNGEGLDFCDFCGTPLGAAPGGKRKTEMEGVSTPSPKRATEMEARGDDPFDPFRPAAGKAPAHAPVAAAPAAAAPAGKRKTEFDGANRGAAGGSDPFAVPAAKAVTPAEERAAGRRIVGFLVTFDRAAEGAYFVLREGRNLFGRDAEECDVVIAGDDMVSTVHAVVLWRNGRTIIDDEKSQNGTFLNEEDVMEKTDLKDGDVIRLGRTRLLCRLLDHAKVVSLWKPAGS